MWIKNKLLPFLAAFAVLGAIVTFLFKIEPDDVSVD